MSNDIIISALRGTQSVPTHPQVWDTWRHPLIGPGSGRDWQVSGTPGLRVTT